MNMRLFFGYDFDQYLKRQEQLFKREIVEKNDLLSIEETVYCELLIEKYAVKPLIFHRDQLFSTVSEQVIFPSEFSASHESYQKQVITYHLPISGNKMLLKMEPFISFYAPMVSFNEELDEIVIEIINWDDNLEKCKKEFSSKLKEIERQFLYIVEQAMKYNRSLPAKIKDTIAQRKCELLKEVEIQEPQTFLKLGG